ncbi:hypothetical protein LEL_07177 [Akanthomyces lecanii RCEF 1005]|uniref:Uncharacterized protein n=1 Tax=Akanthomyces lecanii RCEF 1005 TaxID=1081108 RepID=A0A162N3Z9_CORDF|nr:hypothetical protein LEL_07177 [Akanthomyces lecanii RCEF 1005]
MKLALTTIFTLVAFVAAKPTPNRADGDAEIQGWPSKGPEIRADGDAVIQGWPSKGPGKRTETRADGDAEIQDWPPGCTYCRRDQIGAEPQDRKASSGK